MWICVIAIIAAGILIFAKDGFMRVWMFSMLAAITALFILSIPRSLTIDEQNFNIQCIVELTRIDVRDIRAIRKVDKKEYRYLFPVLGSYGFFGYYGYYLNLRDWDVIKVYAGEWDNFIEITDIYEQTYVISCPQADELIESVMQVKLLHTGRKSI